jgi:hypothetical protein
MEESVHTVNQRFDSLSGRYDSIRIIVLVYKQGLPPTPQAMLSSTHLRDNLNMHSLLSNDPYQKTFYILNLVRCFSMRPFHCHSCPLLN